MEERADRAYQWVTDNYRWPTVIARYEELYEELLIGDNCGPTEHIAIMQARENFIPWADLEIHLEVLEAALDQHDASRVRSILQQLISGYRNQVQGRESHI